MKDILRSAGRAALARIAGPDTLLAFDYDGTLAPIVADRSRAFMRTRTRSLLLGLSRLYPCVVISGRGRAETMKLLAGSGVEEVVGNHGAEDGLTPNSHRRRVLRWRRALELTLRGRAGLLIEDKGFSLAVHYRAARDRPAARSAVEAATAELEGARLVRGKHVVNVVPREALNKGEALERCRRGWSCATALFVGDDVTDEDAFAVGRKAGMLTLRIGRGRHSRAEYYLTSQRLVDDVLQLLLVLRPPCRSGRPSARA